MAAERGHVQYVEFLLKNGAVIISPEKNRQDLVMKKYILQAPMDKQKEVFKTFVEHSANSLEKGDFTCFQHMCFKEEAWEHDYKIAKNLIKHGADVNGIYKLNGKTCFKVAIEKGRIEYAKFLVENGARFQGEWDRISMEYVSNLPKIEQKKILQLFMDYGMSSK